MDATGGSLRDVCPLLARWRSERKDADAKTSEADIQEKVTFLTPEGERAILAHLESVWQIAFVLRREGGARA